MNLKKFLTEEDLAAVAKGFREKAGKNRAEAAREMGVAQTSIFNAEETPSQSLTKLRVRMIEAYSPYKVAVGVCFLIPKKISKTKTATR